jgi:hypothetical protein
MIRPEEVIAVTRTSPSRAPSRSRPTPLLVLCLALASSAALLAACGGGSATSAKTDTKASRSPTPVREMFDFGDAPDPAYPTKLASDGARHRDVTRAWFGAKVDGEVDAHEQADFQIRSGDRTDDGLLGAAPLEFGVTNESWDGPLYVNMLMDLNGDNDWEDDGEWVLQNMEIEVAMGESLEFVTGLVFDELTMLRMTLTGAALEGYVGKGVFDIGETEDHIWTSDVPMGY